MDTILTEKRLGEMEHYWKCPCKFIFAYVMLVSLYLHTNPKKETLEAERLRERRNAWDRLMPVPSTLHTPLHTLNCTAFAIASAVDNIVPKGAGPRAV